MKKVILFLMMCLALACTNEDSSEDSSEGNEEITSENVIIEGKVFDGNNSTPIQGAVVGTSLDSKTATTNVSGDFKLVTNTSSNSGNTPYTITITAAGFQKYSQSFLWGGHPTNQKFYLYH